jgi:hypothetical protein
MLQELPHLITSYYDFTVRGSMKPPATALLVFGNHALL